MYNITYDNKVLVENISTKIEANLIKRGIQIGIDLVIDSLVVAVPRNIDDRIITDFANNITSQQIDWFNLKAS